MLAWIGTIVIALVGLCIYTMALVHGYLLGLKFHYRSLGKLVEIGALSKEDAGKKDNFLPSGLNSSRRLIRGATHTIIKNPDHLANIKG